MYFFNNPKDVNPDEIKDVNISGEMTFCSIVDKDHFKITFNIKNVVVESGNEKKYIDVDGNVFFHELNMSQYSTEDYESDYDTESLCSNDSYDTESLYSNDSYNSSFIDDCESSEDDTEDEFQFM